MPRLIVKIDKAKELAEPYNPREQDPKNDPFNNPENQAPYIPPSLLSAEHICAYVEKTGLIAPFDSGKPGDRKSRLKKAAYEGRIGSKAFFYNDKGMRERIFHEECAYLKVPANSIVYVECDLEFRIPAFIALRFNLQIQHVHRGLLLGTGPLVDPGYWGKLCIPLHNLTDNDYYIGKEEGLIWIEFTKTTSSNSESDKKIGRPPLDGEYWEIEAFLNKSEWSKKINARVPLRSSLPKIIKDSIDKIDEAKKQATKAKSAATSSARTARNIGVGTFVGILTLVVTFYVETVRQNENVMKEANSNAKQIIELNNNITNLKEEITRLESSLRDIRILTENQNNSAE